MSIAILTLSDGRQIELPEQLDLKIRKATWHINTLECADVSFVREWHYGWQRIINDAAGQGTFSEQQKNARDRWADLKAGRIRAITERSDTIMRVAIEIAIEREVRPTFQANRYKLDPKVMKAEAKKIIADNPRYLKAAKNRIEIEKAANAAKKAADDQFFAETDVSDGMALLEDNSAETTAEVELENEPINEYDDEELDDEELDAAFAE
jgi:hypothetical protein